MPHTLSTYDKIIEICEKQGVSIFLDGGRDSDAAKIQTPYTYEPKDKILIIYLVNLKGSTRAKLIPYIRQKWEETTLLLKYSQQQNFDSYLQYKENNTDEETLIFYKDKISVSDFDALKMALFLRNEKSNGRDIAISKQEIRERFGERGAYISNLCTAGYFENDFMNFYNSNPDKFDAFFNLGISREIFAIFVHAGMTFNALKTLIEDKVTLLRRYHLFFGSFKIHGFGSWNVDLIYRVISEYANHAKEDEKEFEWEKQTDEINPPCVIYKITPIPFGRD